MRNCSRCNIDYPMFVWECPKCNRRIVEDKNPSIVATMKLWEDLRQTGGGFWEHAKRNMITQSLGGKTPTPEQAYRYYYQNGLADCELFYSRHAEQLGDRFSRSQFTDYIKQLVHRDSWGLVT